MSRHGAKLWWIGTPRNLELNFASDSRGDMPNTGDEISKRFRTQRLFSIAPRAIRLMVNLNHDRVRAGGDGGQRHLRDEFTKADAVGRVNHHRQFGFRFQNRDRI